MEGGATDQRRQDAEARDRRTRALTCRFGGDCCAGRGWNAPSITRRWRSRSLWMRGSCACVSSWFGAAFVRGANASSRAAVRVAAVVSDATDSDYESADSNDCTDDGSASESGSSGEKWESGSEGVLREEPEEEYREDRRPSRREAIRESIYNGELQGRQKM